MKKFALLLCSLFVFASLSSAQSLITSLWNSNENVNEGILSASFKEYSLFTLDLSDIDAYRTEHNYQIPAIDIAINAGKINTVLQLYNSGIIPHNYVRQTASGNGIDTPIASAMRGYTTEGYPATITLNTNYLHGFIVTPEAEYYIKPARIFDASLPDNLFVLYDTQDSGEIEEAICGTTEVQVQPDEVEEMMLMGECLELSYAVATDYKMYQEYGSTADVENFIISVTNDLNSSYDDEFNDEIKYVIVETYIVDCSGCDPWTSSTNPSDLLDSFTDWGFAGGFSSQYGLGTIWTGRTLDGSTVGLAWIDVICNNWHKYNLLSDFTWYSEYLRVLAAHEIGHNWGYDHDPSGSPYIMAPMVSDTRDWSIESQNLINNKIPVKKGGNCLRTCSIGNNPPIAGFSSDGQFICAGESVQFYDTSIDADSYEWYFEGGTPTTSTDKNPIVYYAQEGVYDVSLTVYNNYGSDEITKTGYIQVMGLPEAYFTFNEIGLLVEFFNGSQNATSFQWDFGDGVMSTDVNPIHVYTQGGTYTVTLIASNDCGQSIYQVDVTVAGIPHADFSADVQEGCAPLTVTFENNSTEATSYEWTFDGGTPSTSTDINPVVTYFNAGTYNVYLVASNSSGEDIEVKNSYIIVKEKPTADFIAVTDGLTVVFTNNSQNADSYHWDFGDGNESMDIDPTHTYGASGDYTVILTAFNECGEVEKILNIGIGDYPNAQFTADKKVGCVPFEVEFQSLYDGEVNNYWWTFEGGNPASSTDANPVVTYENVGSFTVTLVVENNLGRDSLVKENYITVIDEPTADFSSVRNGLTIVFTNESLGADSYHWNFGDGNTSTEESPTHTYDESGEYVVTLTVSNECGEAQKSIRIAAGDFPNAQFSGSTTSGCVPLTVSFTNLYDGEVTGYWWTFQGGSPGSSTDESPEVTYNSAGTYDVTLIVENGLGRDTLIMENYISVNDKPTADFTSSTNGLTVTFTNNSQNADSYHWDFGDGNESTEASPTHTYSSDGDYTVVLTATNDCGSSTKTIVVGAGGFANAQFSVGETIGCAPFSVKMINQSSGNELEYEWTFNGGTPATSTEREPTVTYTSPGIYSIRLVAYNGISSDTLIREDYIEVLARPSADFEYTVEDETVTFVNLSQNADSYLWDFDDGNTSTEENPVHTYTDGLNSHNVTLTVYSQCGEVEKTVLILLGSPLDAQMAASTNKICAGGTVDFFDVSEGVVESRLWTFEGGQPASSTEENPIVSYNQPGRYRVTLEIGNVGGTDVIVQEDYITVIDVPRADFDYVIDGNQVQFIQKSTYAEQYRWDLGDGTIINNSQPSHKYGNVGSYTVKLRAMNTCGEDSIEKIIRITTAIDGLQGSQFRVYPNPFNDYLAIEFTDEISTETEISLIDLSGKVIVQKKVDTLSADKLHIAIEGIHPGVYVLQVKNQEGTIYRKLIKQ